MASAPAMSPTEIAVSRRRRTAQSAAAAGRYAART